jgi:hypothetical protein
MLWLKGTIAVAIVAIVAGGYTYIQYKDNLIAELNTQNIQLKEQKKSAVKLNKSLKNQLYKRDKEVKDAFNQILKLKVEDIKIQGRLRRAEQKAASRDWGKLRSGKHAELALKVINRSTIKMFKVFEDETN